MSTLDLVRYYSNLLIVQYHGLPRASATIELSAASVVMPQTSVQAVTLTLVPFTGQLVLAYDGVTAPAIDWDDSEATIQTKLRTIPALAAVVVSGSLLDGGFTVTFTGVDAPAELLEIISNTLGGVYDGGFASTTDFGLTLEGGDAFTEYPDIIDGGDAFGSGYLDVTISVAETDDTLPLAVQNGYDLSTAVGDQLDVLAKYIGVSRSGAGFAGRVTLDDADFLTLMQIGIIRNSAQSDLGTIQDFLFRFFPDSIRVFDYKNMRMSYLISTSFGSLDLIQLFVTEGLLPRPMAVQVAAVIYVPDIDNFFGFRTYQAPAFRAQPFNTYADYQLDRPWLSYAMAVVP